MQWGQNFLGKKPPTKQIIIFILRDRDLVWYSIITAKIIIEFTVNINCFESYLCRLLDKHFHYFT